MTILRQAEESHRNQSQYQELHNEIESLKRSYQELIAARDQEITTLKKSLKDIQKVSLISVSS